MRRWLKSGVTIALLIACAGVLSAQNDRKSKREAAGLRVVQGVVVDRDDKPVAGAVVKLKDPAGIRNNTTKEDGSYHFSGLKVDTNYELKADYNDATTTWKRLSVFDERKVAIINLKLDQKKEKEK